MKNISKIMKNSIKTKILIRDMKEEVGVGLKIMSDKRIMKANHNFQIILIIMYRNRILIKIKTLETDKGKECISRMKNIIMNNLLSR